MPGERILIIEDEEAIAELIAESLKRQGYQVLMAYDGDQGLDLAFETLPDLLILDLMLPKLDGWEICRRLKEERNTRDILILMLTARRDERDVIEGLELGADDYVSKPFSLSELQRGSRLIAQTRRRSALGAVLNIGSLKIDMEAQEATLNGNALDLSPTEYKLLEVLARNEGRTLSRDELLAKVWGTTLGDSRTVDVHIWRLRHKLADDGDEERFIQTVRGRGYRLRFEREKRENA